MTDRSFAVQKLQALATAARQAGQTDAAEALTFAADLVTARLKAATAQKTLRDELAMAALTGRLAAGNWTDRERVAEGCYKFADAMLAAREA